MAAPLFEHDQHHLAQYQAFASLYGIENLEQLVKLYDIFELVAFMPANPTNRQKEALQELIGVEAPLGYMDYYRSGNTFELIMQWQEKTGDFLHQSPISAVPPDKGDAPA